jgi:hypothetical protein
MWTFKIYSRNTKTTNEPTASNNKSDRPQMKICDTWKTLKYLNINDSFHLKDLAISKYKRESKGSWPIQICRFIFVNCCLISLSIIVQVKNIIIERNEFSRIGYNGFFFCIRTQVRPSPEYSCGKRNPLYPIRAASFVSIVLYPIYIHVVYCMFF